jgi:transposase, IS30 family
MLQMDNRKRRHYTDTEKSMMWDRWQKGESMNEIGRSFGIQGHSSIQRIFSETGGIRPAKRRRSARALSLAEREEISRGIVIGRSIRSIALELGRAPSTVSREIRRNSGR